MIVRRQNIHLLSFVKSSGVLLERVGRFAQPFFRCCSDVCRAFIFQMQLQRLVRCVWDVETASCLQKLLGPRTAFPHSRFLQPVARSGHTDWVHSIAWAPGPGSVGATPFQITVSRDLLQLVVTKLSAWRTTHRLYCMCFFLGGCVCVASCIQGE